MATVTAFTAARSLEIEQSTVTSGTVDVNGDLILSTRGGTPINAGHVVGPAGTPVNTLEQSVKNNTGFTINKGSAVYISGATGDNALISKAQANTEATSSKVLGLVSDNILTGVVGEVITEGELTGLDTSTAIAGDSVWLSPTVPGGLVYGLANKPSAPNHMVYLGVVIRAHAVNGVINVKVQNGYELDELHNVAITAQEKGQILVHDGTNWVNSKPLSTNYILNGAFEIWQRGDSMSPGFGADRWAFYSGSNAWTLSKIADTPDNIPGYSFKLTNDSAKTIGASDYSFLETRIEGYDVSELGWGYSYAKPVTLSFYVKASVTGTYSGLICGALNEPNIGFNFIVNSANTWERKYVTIANPPTTGGSSAWSKTDGIGLWLKFDVGSGANYKIASAGTWLPGANKAGVTGSANMAATANSTFSLAGVQLEAGTIMTPFRRKSPSVQAEMAACQRYFMKLGWWDYSGVAQTDRAVSGWNKLPVTMRAQPTATPSGSTPFYSLNASGTYGWGTPGIVQTSPNQVLWITGIWPTISPYHAVSVIGGNFYMNVSAEL